MAEAERQSPESVRREIEFERERLAHAVDSLRDAAKVTVNVPVVAAAAFGVGFFLAGGIGATVRLMFRRGREHPRD
jgi:pseudouridine-5'-phosphate glycosidase